MKKNTHKTFFRKAAFALLTPLLFGACNYHSRQAEPIDADSLLVLIHERDQQVRQELMMIQRAFIAEQRAELADSIMMLSEAMDSIDNLNRCIVDSLLREGWPEGLSEAACNTLWLVIDHADVDYQERYLPLIEQQVKLGTISASDYATLSDRIDVRRQRPQRYGTQTGYTQRDDQFFCYVYPIANAESLDSLRLSVGLDSIHIYLAQVSQVLGTTVSLDPQLTWEQLNAQIAALNEE